MYPYSTMTMGSVDALKTLAFTAPIFMPTTSTRQVLTAQLDVTGLMTLRPFSAAMPPTRRISSPNLLKAAPFTPLGLATTPQDCYTYTDEGFTRQWAYTTSVTG